MYKTYFKQNKNKYNNKKCEYNGSIYDSRLEARVASDLDLRKKAGEIEKIEKQVKCDLICNGCKSSMFYRPDFIVYYPDGTKEFLEVKSFITQTPVWKLKWFILQTMYLEESKKDKVKFTVALSTSGGGYKFVEYKNLKKVK